MKKLKVLILFIIAIFGGLFFTACTEAGVLCEQITVLQEEIYLQLGEVAEVGFEITPSDATKKELELVGDYLDVARIDIDYDNSKLIVTARDFVTANKTDAMVGIRTTDGSEKEAHIQIYLLEENQSVKTPKNLTLSGNKLVWQSVDNALGYTICVNEEPYVVYQNSFDINLDEYAGTDVSVKVKANGRASNLDSAYTTELNFYVLNRPTGISYSDDTGIVSWNDVEQASSYVLYLNNRPYYTETTNLNISEYLNTVGQYDIKVKANGQSDGSIANSAFSNSLILTKLASPENVNIQNGVASWKSVVGAVGYDIEYQYSSNGVVLTKTERLDSVRFTLPTDLAVGDYRFRIKAIGNGKTTITSDFGVQRIYTKLATVKNLRVENGDITWDVNNLATSYTIYFENLDDNGNVVSDTISQNSGATSITYSISNRPAGDYRIDVVANGLDDKISSEKTGNPISVKKLLTPINLQATKENGESIIQWTNDSFASGYRLLINNDNSNEKFVSKTNGEFATYRFSNADLVDGLNTISIKAIGNYKNNGVWILNSEYSTDLVLTKLLAPIISVADIANGNAMWSSLDSQGFESYQIKILTSNGSLLFTDTISQNSINFNNIGSYYYDLPVGTYRFAVKTIAKQNTNYYDSDFSTEIFVKKAGIKNLSVYNGQIEDLLSDDENYEIRYFVSTSNQYITSINDFSTKTIKSGEIVSVKTQLYPTKLSVNDVYLVPGNYSAPIYIKKLPTIENVNMVDGVLNYGSNYADLDGYKFILKINDDEIENGTSLTYDFSNVDAGDYAVSIRAVSTQAGDGQQSSYDNPLLLDSYQMKSPFTFKRLSAPGVVVIPSFATGNMTIGDLADRINSNLLGNQMLIFWKEVPSATVYEVIVDGTIKFETSNTYISLQNTDVGVGTHTILIKAIGNGKEIISSDYERFLNRELVKHEFGKVQAPDKLYIEDGKIKWSYTNQANDPNFAVKELIANSSFDGFEEDSTNELLLLECKLCVYVLVDANGREYSTIDINKIDGETEFEKINSLITQIKSNECEIPQGLDGNATFYIFARPLNLNIGTDLSVNVNQVIRYVDSDYSSSLNLTALQTPKSLNVENRKISWSGLRYNLDKTEDNKPLDSYLVTIKTNQATFEFSVKEDSTKDYYIDAENKVVYIDDFANSDNCYWYFTKENFENFFGEDSYQPGIYSITIKAIAKNISYQNDENRYYYYCDSLSSNAQKVEVLENPMLFARQGYVVWNKIANAQSYKLYIKYNGTQEIVEIKNLNYFALEKDYLPGEYDINIQAIGDEKNTFTAEFDEENNKIYRKLNAITSIYVENGVIKYNLNSEDTDTNYKFVVYVRNNEQEEREDVTIQNAQHTVFELGSQFEGGKSYIVRVMVAGDDTMYLNSEISNHCLAGNGALPTKLTNPQSATIENGRISWVAVPYASYYRVSISGQDNEINTSKVYYDISNITSGTYTVFVKAIGNNIYLNSSQDSGNTITKLENIKNLTIEDGYLAWDCASIYDYVVVINGQEIVLTEQNSKIEDGRVYYNFSGYETGDYSFYIYNYGGTRNISSAKTSTYNVSKLASPNNLRIEDNVLKFDGVDNAEKYYISISAGTKQVTIKQLFEQDIKDTTEINFDDIKQAISKDFANYSSTSLTYTIKVVAVGSSVEIENMDSSNNFVTSNESNEIVITQPAAPTITAIYNQNGMFAGKIVWDEVENADYYEVNVAFYDSLENANNNFVTYKVQNKTYFNVTEKGFYKIYVLACKNINSYNSENSNILENMYFGLFEDGNGSENNPFVITDVNGINSIKFNIDACYQLANDIEINDDLELIGTDENRFDGSFDGNNKTITLKLSSTNQVASSLFGTIGQNGVVKNLNIVCENNSTKQQNNTINIASIAEINYGKVQNIAVYGTLLTKYNDLSTVINCGGVVAINYGTISYTASSANIEPQNNQNLVNVGGVVAINYGTIEKSGFVGKASGQFVGGIASQNLGGTISQCYYETNNTYSTNLECSNTGRENSYVGGIVGYMQGGKISYCYVNGEIIGRTSSANTDIKTYIGGIAGYVESTKNSITNSYVIGYKGTDTTNIQISSNTSNAGVAYVGVFVGDNNVDSSGGNVYCLRDKNQAIIGVKYNSFNNSKTVENLSDYRSRLGSQYFNNNMKLINAKYL